MAITCVVGPPGAGKTFWTVRAIVGGVRSGRCVATNVRLVDGWADTVARSTVLRFQPRRRRRTVARWERRLLYVDTLAELGNVRLRTEGWEGKLEGRGIAVFDEAGEALDARAWNEDKERRKLDNRFMRQHRKLGWDVFLVAQEEEQLDARVRGMATYIVRLVNLRSMKLAWFFPVKIPWTVFRARWDWHGSKTTRDPYKLEVYKLNKSIARLYDTNQLVAASEEEEAAYVWLPLDSVPLPEPSSVEQHAAATDAAVSEAPTRPDGGDSSPEPDRATEAVA